MTVLATCRIDDADIWSLRQLDVHVFDTKERIVEFGKGECVRIIVQGLLITSSCHLMQRLVLHQTISASHITWRKYCIII